MEENKLQKKIEVFVVTYNRIEYLKIAIQSILNQTFSNFTLTVLDNCSTDGTESYIKSIEDKRVNYVRHEHNLGGTGNISYAFEHCGGEYFAVFHDDDVLHPNLLEEEISYLDTHKECAAVSCLSNNIDENGNYTLKREWDDRQRIFSGKQFFEEYMNNQKSFTFPATLYRTNFIKIHKINIKSEPGPCADVVLYMDIEKEGGTITEIPKALIDYRIYKNQDSSLHLEEMLVKLINYLSEDEYYSQILKEDVVGQKKYFKWYFRRLLSREVSKCIKYDDAQNYLKIMNESLGIPIKSVQSYKVLLWTANKLLVPANIAYRIVKKVKSKL